MTPARHSRARRLLVEWLPPAITVLLVVGLFTLWYALSSGGGVQRIVLPAPDAVASAVPDVVGAPEFWTDVSTTAREAGIGYAIAAVSAIFGAMVTMRFGLLRRVLSPYIVVLATMPKVVLVPIFGVWFGLGEITATLFVILVCFFPIYVSTFAGLGLTDENGLKLLRSLGASDRQTFRMLRVPTALPLVFSGLKASAAYAVAAAVSAEFLGSSKGLGFLVINSTTFFRIEEVWAAVAIITLLAAAVYVAVELIGRKIVFWGPER